MIAKYKLVAEKIKDHINSDELFERRLPTERELALIHGVSRQTIREALDLLIKDHYIYKVQGSGIYVSDAYFSARNKIALIVESEEDYIYPELISYLKDAVSPHGFSLDIHVTNGHMSSLFDVLNSIKANPVRGIISIPVRSALPAPFESVYSELIKMRIPSIFYMDTYSYIKDIPCVRYDDTFSAYRVTLDLLQESSCLYGIFLTDSVCSHYRFSGFIQAATEKKLSPENIHVKWISSEELREYRTLSSIKCLKDFVKEITSDSNRNVALLCHNDEIAACVCDLIDKRKDMPAICSFDKSYLSRLPEYDFVSYSPDKKEMAQAVIKRLMAIMDRDKNDTVRNSGSLSVTFPVSF